MNLTRTWIRAVLLGGALAAATLAHAQDSAAVETVNVNSADAETLARVLDGVGLARAQAIVTWREENGAFRSVDDLLDVKGIGAATLERNEGRVVFED